MRRHVLAAALAVSALPASAQQTVVTDAELFAARQQLFDGDAAGAASFLEAAAKAGDPRAQYLWGSYFEYGDLGSKNAQEALRWYGMAADQGYPHAMYATGILYRYGMEGLEPDLTLARAAFERAAKLDYGPALAELGLMFRDGVGVTADVDLGTAYLQRGVDTGDASASTVLGYSYENGIGVEQDLEEARRLYLISALQGNYAGQNNAGWMYANGYGGELDLQEAAEWYRKSMAQGYDLPAINMAYLIQANPELDARPFAAEAYCLWAEQHATILDYPDGDPGCVEMLNALARSDLKTADRLADILLDEATVE